MMLRMFSDQAIEKATGKKWAQWCALLKAMNAATLPHKEIAARLHRDHAVSGWWAQALSVQFERSIGRRKVGQTCQGDFAASASKTVPGTKDDVLAAWRRLVGKTRGFGGIAFAASPTTSKTEKWRYWRVGLADGSKVMIVIGDKAGGNALLGVNHDKLADAEAAARWKAYWRRRLEALSQ